MVIDKYEFRKQKLIEIRDRYCDGKVSILADKLDKNHSQIGKLFWDANKPQRRNVSDKLVDEIENIFKLPRGWMDGLAKKTTAELIKEKYTEQGFTLAQLAVKAGITHNSLLQIVAGEIYPSVAQIETIATVLECDPDELISDGKTELDALNKGYPLRGSNSKRIPTAVRVSGQAFWFRVDDNSMTAPAGLTFPEGVIILFDPEVEPEKGKFVLVKTGDGVTFKQLVIDAGQQYLRALNPSYPLLTMKENDVILGVAVEAKWESF